MKKKIVGNIVGLPSPRSDWNQNNEMKADFIKNRPIKEINAIRGLMYYGDANVVPSDASLFNFVLDDDFMTADVNVASENVEGYIVIPYEYVVGENVYTVTSIGNIGTGFRSSRVVEVIIPSSVNVIGDNAFFDCEELIRIAIPEGVEGIGASAFALCHNLSSVVIPKTTLLIGNQAFVGCDSLTDVYYGGAAYYWGEINIKDDNAELLEATLHYNYTDVDKGYIFRELDGVREGLSYLGEQVGNIDNTLDDILAIQNTLIGGDSE